MIDPYLKGICLAVKWIRRALEGNSPWKFLVRHRVQTTTASKAWSTVQWSDKILLAP
jgi:hypothetical protein